MIPLSSHYRILEMVPLFRMNEEEEAPSYTMTCLLDLFKLPEGSISSQEEDYNVMRGSCLLHITKPITNLSVCVVYQLWVHATYR